MLKRILIAAALAGALGGGPALAAGDRLSDTWKEASISTAFTLNGHLNPFDVDVEVNGDTAQIIGKVESEVEKDLAEQIALGVEGITKVENNLQVVPDAPRRDADAGSLSSAVSDAGITAKVKSKLLWNRSTSGLDVNVTTRGHVVQLRGTVGSEAERELVRRIAADTAGVRSVDDQLTVAPSAAAGTTPAPAPAQQITAGNLKERASDAWITTKVKSALLYSNAVDGTAINVDTSGGVVTLSGRVWDENARQQAVAIAEGIIGVRSVRSNLQIPGSS